MVGFQHLEKEILNARGRIPDAEDRILEAIDGTLKAGAGFRETGGRIMVTTDGFPEPGVGITEGGF